MSIINNIISPIFNNYIILSISKYNTGKIINLNNKLLKHIIDIPFVEKMNICNEKIKSLTLKRCLIDRKLSEFLIKQLYRDTNENNFIVILTRITLS
jgi:hypothetical protein